ncbi:sensor histidine kinase [Paradesulfitobacterium aromaticivorans]
MALLTEALITGLYVHGDGSVKAVRIAVIAETVGITLLLILTGGLGSPFTWYALNPILLAASSLPLVYCWLDLTLYFSLIAATSMIGIYSQPHALAILSHDIANSILVLILVTLAVPLAKRSDHLSLEVLNLQNNLQDINGSLRASKEKTERTRDQALSLYRVAAQTHNQDDLRVLIHQGALVARHFTESETSFFWLAPSQWFCTLLDTAPIQSPDFNAILSYRIQSDWAQLSTGTIASPIWSSGKHHFLITVVKSSEYAYGLLGIEWDEPQQDISTALSLLVQLAQTTSRILDKIYLDKVKYKHLLTEERNRIAGEMHDTLSQSLFGIAYGIYSLRRSWKNMQSEKLQEQLDLISETASEAVSELRTSIYRLSSKQKPEQTFRASIQTYLDNFSKLYDVSISLETGVEYVIIVDSLRKALHRIIRESLGNAVRHGECHNIQISVFVKGNMLRLMIKDDGKGFNREKINENDMGLGLTNMKALVQTYGGMFNLESSSDFGTNIDITIPLDIHKTEDLLFSDKRGGAA